MAKPAFAPLDLATPRVRAEPLPGGATLLHTEAPLEPFDSHVGVWLDRWASRAPERPFLRERAAEGWRTVTFGDAQAAAAALGQALLERGATPERPLLLLSGNSIDHALLTLGAMHAGIPAVPVSPAYSVMSEDFGKLRHVHALVQPGVVYAANPEAFAPALAALGIEDQGLLVTEKASPHEGAALVSELIRTRPGPEVGRASQEVGPDTIAKILFTSGSTGLPKGVVNTHRMLCSNQQAIAQCWPFIETRPPVLVDWLPWNHTFGGNHNFNLVLRNGGTLYIDAGKPRPGLIEETVRNLREVSPTLYFNVPAGFAALLPYLERDHELRARFFDGLDLIFYAGAALSQDLWQRLEDLAIQTRGQRVLMTSAWGSTETSPLATSAHFPLERAGNIGVPAPGTAIKLVPSGSKLELRVKGPNVTPGYFRQPELTEEAFDEDGFYRIGDAGRLVSEEDPSEGILFDGRVAEDFKLATGTWVHAGAVRVAALEATTPALLDAVVTGHDRPYIGLLAWPNLAACRGLLGLAEDAPAAEVLASDGLRSHLRSGLQRYNEGVAHRTSQAIGRVLLLAEPPSIDAGEITDKGYINQRAALESRGAAVEALYAEPPAPEVLVLDR